METAEKLYNKGLISYPRTETNYFNKNIDLVAIIKSLTATKSKWSPYARKMLNTMSSHKYFEYPKNGKLDDQAHPPIHPVAAVSMTKLDHKQQRLYELICRHFLAICSHDGLCSNTRVTLKIGDESFMVSGQTIDEPGYLEVYSIYEKIGENILPEFLTQVGHKIPMSDLRARLQQS